MSMDTRDHDLQEILQIQTLPKIPLPLKAVLQKQFSSEQISSTPSPQLLVIGGGPGAGKSFFYHYLLHNARLPSEHVLHDPDYLLQAIPDYQREYCVDPEAAFRRWELPARQLSHELLLEALLKGQSVVYVRTLAYSDSVDLLAYCKQYLGYRLTIHLLTCPIELAMQRALTRQDKLHRHLSLEVIRDRHQKVLEHIPRLQVMADHYVQYDNSLNDRMPERA